MAEITVRSEIDLSPLSAPETIAKTIEAIERKGVTVLRFSVGTDYQRGVELDWDTGFFDVWLGILNNIGIPTPGEQPITITVKASSEREGKRAVHEGIAETTGWTDSLRQWLGELNDNVVTPTIVEAKQVIQDGAHGFGVGLGGGLVVVAAIAAAYFLAPVIFARRAA